MMDQNSAMSAEGFPFPGPLQEAYDILSCLNWGDRKSTWLCRRKEDCCQVLIKVAEDQETAFRLKKEEEMLLL